MLQVKVLTGEFGCYPGDKTNRFAKALLWLHCSHDTDQRKGVTDAYFTLCSYNYCMFLFV